MQGHEATGGEHLVLFSPRQLPPLRLLESLTEEGNEKRIGVHVQFHIETVLRLALLSKVAHEGVDSKLSAAHLFWNFPLCLNCSSLDIMELKTLKGLALHDILTEIHLFVHRGNTFSS